MSDDKFEEWHDIEPSESETTTGQPSPPVTSEPLRPATKQQPTYATVDEFVSERLRFMYARKVGPQNVAQFRWAADWWNYPEAISRLEALWRAWEHLRLDGPLGMSTWWRDHADYHMGILMGADGPFAKSTDRNEWDDPLPISPRPPAS